MKNWEKPRWCELNMNAEIGSYQPDPGSDEPRPLTQPGAEQTLDGAREQRARPRRVQ